MNYVEDTKYFQYVIECAIEQEKINGFIKTITGVNEGASFKKLDSIHEAVGDKIRSLWDKFIAFLNRIWAKFSENCRKLIDSEVGYLEEYKDIILNRKPESVDIEMRPYDTGIHRMTSTPVEPFITVKDKVNVDATDNSFRTHLIKEYTDYNKEFSSFCIAYFEGGEDKKSTNLTSLNMTDLYNYCHDYKKIIDILEKDKNTLGKTFNDIQALITKAQNAAKAGEVKKDETTNTTAAATESGNKPTSTGAYAASSTHAPTMTKDMTKGAPKEVKQAMVNQMNKSVDKQKQSGLKLTGHKADYIDDYIGSYFNEDITIGSKPDTNAANNSAATTGNDKASANIKSVQTHATPVKVEDQGEDLDTLNSKLKNYNTDAGTVLAAKKTAAEAIFKDYMKIIRLHVGHHVGKEGDTQVAKSGTSHAQNLVIDGPDEVLNTIAQIEDEKTSNNDKHKLTTELNAKVIAKNPNFPGGIAAIKAAATAAKNAPKK